MARSLTNIEIPSSNDEKMKDFYKTLCDWDATVIPMGEDVPPYTMFTTGNVMTALSPIGDTIQPGQLMMYISSEDIEADLTIAQNLGATIVTEKTEVPGFGWFGIFIDPSGNRMAFWQDLPE